MTENLNNPQNQLSEKEKYLQTETIIKNYYKKSDIDINLIELYWKKIISVDKNKDWIIDSFRSLDWYFLYWKWEFFDTYFLVLKKLWLTDNEVKDIWKKDKKELYNTYMKMGYFYDREMVWGLIWWTEKLSKDIVNYYSLLQSPFFTLLDFANFQAKWLIDKDSFKDDNDREEVLKRKKAELKYWIKNWVDDVDLFIMPKFLPDYAIADKKQARDIVTKHGQLLTNKKIITKENIDFILKQWLINEDEANEYNKLIEERDSKKDTDKDLEQLKGKVSNE